MDYPCRPVTGRLENRGQRVRRSVTWRALMPVLCTVCLIAVGGDSRGATTADTAGAFLQAYSDKSIQRLTESGIGQKEQEARFRRLLGEGFDLPSIGAFVLGRYAGAATDDERKAFLQAFQDAMAQRFLPLFSKHRNERLQVVREFVSESDPRSTFVNTLITQPSAQPIKVDWRVRARDGQFKIIDVIIEGVSMAATLRSDYTAVLARNNGRVPALTELLRRRVAEGAFAPDRPIRKLLD